MEQRKQRFWERVGAGSTWLEFVPWGAPSARRRSQPAGDHPRAPPFSGESAVAQHLAPHQVTRARTLRAARPSGSPAAPAEPRRAPSDCSAPSHTRPARPVTQPGNGGTRARPGWRRRDPGTRPSTCLFVPVALGLSQWSLEGPRWGLAPPWEGWGGGVPALPAASTLSPGGRSSSSPAPPTPALDKVKLSRWRSFPLPGSALSLPSPALESKASAEGDQRPRVSPSWCSKVTRAKRTHPWCTPALQPLPNPPRWRPRTHPRGQRSRRHRNKALIVKDNVGSAYGRIVPMISFCNHYPLL